MGIEDSEQDQAGEEFARRKEGSGQIPSGRNPRGAGRPTSEWLEFKREQKEFQAWKEATARGEFASSATISERLDRFIDGRGDGDSKEQPKGFVEGALKVVGLDKVFKDLKFDKVELLMSKGWAYIAPYVLPTLGGAVAVFVGATGLYIVEEIDKTDKYTLEEWNALDRKVQLSYHTLNGRVIPKEERVAETISLFPSKFDKLIDRYGDGEEEQPAMETPIVIAVRKAAPQIIHTVMEFQEWFTGTVESVQNFFGVDDFPLFKMQNMFYYHVRKYFAKLSSLFEKTFDK